LSALHLLQVALV